MVRCLRLLVTLLLITALHEGEMGAQIRSAEMDIKQVPDSKRPVTVKDIIEMTQPADVRSQGGIVDAHHIARFSPDRRHFVVTLKKGNLSNNTTDYWIDCFDVKKELSIGAVRRVAHFTSASNQPGIRDVRWAGNSRLLFIAKDSDNKGQLYTVDIGNRHLTKLTTSSQSVTQYSADSTLRRIVYSTELPTSSEALSHKASSETIIQTQSLSDLLLDRNAFDHDFMNDVYVSTVNGGRRLIRHLDVHGAAQAPLFMSPDGHFAVVKTPLQGRPNDKWQRYDDPPLREQLSLPHEAGQPQFIYQLQLIDLSSGWVRPLIDAPIPTGDYPDVIWSADSLSVMLSGVHLPLDSDGTHDEPSRRMDKFVVEVPVDNRPILPISTRSVRLRTWDSKTGFLCGVTGTWSGADSLSNGNEIAFKKIGAKWIPSDFCAAGDTNYSRADVELVEDMNTPPRLDLVDRQSGMRRQLLVLNPQFKHLRLGRVQDLGTISVSGVSVRAGLYLPIDYDPQRRYPLIIQTHEWSPDRFWMDGPFSSANAAQVFVGRGFVVAQVAMNRSSANPREQVEAEARGYDAVIDYLDSRKMIDTQRIGIIGFSWTVMAVKRSLVHSKYHFAAATLADGTDEGYFRYIASVNSLPWQVEYAESINGGIPSNHDLSEWFHQALDLDVASSTIPIRLESYGPVSLLMNWEVFGMRRRLGTPVDFVYLQDGEHVLVKPLDRLASQGGNVDWFCFWLLGQEEASAAKQVEYRRWRSMRSPTP